MTTADRARTDLQTADAALAAARPDPFPRWVPPVVAVPYVAGFASLAVAAWTGGLGWAIAGVGLLVAFFVLFVVAYLRMPVRAYPRRTRRQHAVEFGILGAAVLVYVFLDEGVALLLAGLAFGITCYRQLTRQGRA
ncbi:hypothetical protein [Kineococcus sp. NPDC059986]|jgi:hypothetical protein|uniref:hypothetical protein n=1 Tax=Kineococcus sp. NPDC059986 TaxID=3155538 RepID=UPI00344EF277